MSGGDLDLDLPVPSTRTSSEDHLEFNEAPGDADLGELELPDSGASDPMSDFDLMSPTPPPLQDDGFPALDLSTPVPQQPSVSHDPVGDFSLEADLTGGEGAAPQVASGGSNSLGSEQHGETDSAFGEIDLGTEAGLENMEFSEIPEDPSRDSLPPGAPSVRPQEPHGLSTKPASKEEKGKRGLRVFAYVGTAMLIVVATGVGAGLWSPYGYFGMYAAERLLPMGSDDASVETAIEAADAQAMLGSYADTRHALATLARARREKGLSRLLLSQSLIHESLFLLQFGKDAHSASRADAIAGRLEQRGWDAPAAHLAQGAHALANDDLAGAGRHLSRVEPEVQKTAVFYIVKGELALREDRLEDAVGMFTRAATLEKNGARAKYELAHALLSAGKSDEAQAALEDVLSKSPGHAGARVALARLRLKANQPEAALELARQAAGVLRVDDRQVRAAPTDRASAWSIIGRVHEEADRRREATEAYKRALAANPRDVGSLVGQGRVLLNERRFRDALSRFEAALGSEKDLQAAGLWVEAKVGAARAMMEMDRVHEAKRLLESLDGGSGEVQLTLGAAYERLGNHQAAEEHYKKVVEVSPQRFDGYVALAKLLHRMERRQEAAAVLNEAHRKVSEDASMHYQLGELASEQGRLEEARREFERALTLERGYGPALFGLAVVHRNARHFDKAIVTLDRLAEVEPSFPGLALERGRVFELQGSPEQAVVNYTRALERGPENADLLMRLATVQVSAAQYDAAENTLAKIEADASSSAQAEYLRGRIAFGRGDFAKALQAFEDAVQVDPTRADYYVYLARAAFEGNALGKALSSIERALERDEQLADAYWTRARIRVRTGAVQDALQDARRALDLNPNRYDAYVVMGDAFEQLRKRREAVKAYERALESDPNRAIWWYHLGRLKLDASDLRGAAAALTRATGLADEEAPAPSWFAEAHRLQGDALRLQRDHAGAVVHYRKYIELAAAHVDVSDIERYISRVAHHTER